MRTLYLGLIGDDVRAWEHFLLGIDPSCSIIVDGKFDQATKDETKKFQRQVGFVGADVDGVVGPRTLGKALGIGFDPLHDDRTDEDGPNWPPAPKERPLSLTERVKVFGRFSYVASGEKSNPEQITITDGWDVKNIVTIDVPQLHSVSGSNGKASVHRLVAPQFLRTFAAWEQAGLMKKVRTWGGSWAPRFIRGSRTTLSNHAWGTAFDINVQWNMLGTRPALKGEVGSVRELVEIAHDNGWYWGGHFHNRLDGMHLEAFKVIP